MGGYKLIPLEEADAIYARPTGERYHLKRECRMLNEFEKFGYKEITPEEVKRRKLFPCPCAYKL